MARSIKTVLNDLYLNVPGLRKGELVTDIKLGDYLFGERKQLVGVAGAKAGATAGWVVAAGDDISLATAPKNLTSSTLVIPLADLRVGDCIRGFHLVGRLGATALNATVLDASIRKQTAAAASIADASVLAMTQISVTANTVLDASTTETRVSAASADVLVAAGVTYYLLLTLTTANNNACLAQLAGAYIITEPRYGLARLS